MSFKTFQVISSETVKGAALQQLAQSSLGSDEFNGLVFSGNVVDGDNFTLFQGQWTGRAHYEFNTDTLTTNGRKFWLKLLAATALTLGDTSLSNTNVGSGASYGVIRQVTITAHGFSVGQVFAVGTENFLVLAVDDVNHVDVLRGYAGSTVASHASGAAVLAPANYTGINLGYDIIVPVTSLTIGTAGPEIATALTALDGFNPKYNGSLANGIVPFISSKKLFLDWDWDSSVETLLFHRPARANSTSSTTVIAVGSVTNATLLSTTLIAGVQIGECKDTVVTRVPTAAEVTAGAMHFFFSQPIQAWTVLGFVTATKAVATIGATVSFSTDFRRLTLTNNGTNNFAATDTIQVRASF